MSEKRFTTKNIVCSNYCVWDNNDKPYGNDELVDLLNEQQSTIQSLKEENEKLTKMLNANYKTNNELVQYIQMLESDNDE